jgi:hypothetical protein
MRGLTRAHDDCRDSPCSFPVLNHPQYSPDLAPSDFHLFPKLKEHLRGHHILPDDEVKTAVMVDAQFCRSVFIELSDRWRKYKEPGQLRIVTRQRDWMTRVRFPAEIILFATASRLAVRLTQPPIQCVPRALFPRVEGPGREADCSPPSSFDVKNEWSYISTPTIRLHGVMPNKAQGLFLLLQRSTRWLLVAGSP